MVDLADGPITRRGWRWVLAVACVLSTFPAMLIPRNVGVDPEWVVGLNVLTARGADLGGDIIFSYGPLGPTLVPRDVGANLAWVVPIRLLIHAVWWIAIARLLFRPTLAHPGDAVLFSGGTALGGILTVLTGGAYPMGVLSCCWLGVLERRAAWGIPAVVLAAWAVLAKFSDGVACVATVAVWMAVLLILGPRRRSMAGRLTSVVMIGIAVFLGSYRVCSGPLTNLPRFVSDATKLAGGYSSQLALPGGLGQNLGAVVSIVGFGIAGTVATVRRWPSWWAYALLAIPLLFLYKWSITRMDGFRVVSALLILGGLLALFLAGELRPGERRVGRWLVGALLVWNVIAIAGTQGASAFLNGPRAIVALVNWSTTRAAVERQSRLNTEKAALPESFLARLGNRLVDIQASFDYNPFALHDLNWTPRPVLQSILTCDPELDRRCASFYDGPSAPEFLLYRHETIDRLHPALVDCQTWREALRWYDLAETSPDRLLLARRAKPRWSRLVAGDVLRLKLGEDLPIPDSDRPVQVIQVRFERTVLGRIAQVVYKLPKPTLRVRYRDGSEGAYHVLWRNLEGGFWAADLPADLAATARLFDPSHGEGNPVASLRLEADPRFFAPSVEIRTFRVEP